MTRPGSSSRVYIGHCEADQPAAKRLATSLRDEQGIEVWLADWEVGLGEVIVTKHEQAIAQAEVALLVFSDRGLRDVWMRQQYAAMLHQALADETRLVIPVLDGITHEQLPPMLAILRSAPISAVSSIAAALGKWLGPAPRPKPSTPNISAAELATYRKAVRERYGVNRFIGFTSAFESQLAWEELYVDLVMDEAHGHSKDVRATEPSARELREAEGTKVSLDEAFRYAHDNGRRALVMLGDPGSGKTTQLQQVLLRVLDPERGPASLQLPEGTVPVFVALQEFSRAIEALGAHAEFESLVTWAAVERLGGISAEVIMQLLASPRVLYLLDGLDEIPDPKQRVRVSMMIAKAHVNGPSEHHMLVSSRYAGYADVRQVHRSLGNAFLELQLRPLDDDQVEHLVLNWHRAVESRDAQKQGRPASEDDARHRAKALLRRIRAPKFSGEDRLAEMARTPLLLTALCLIDRERRSKGEEGLPQVRSAIYRECEEILLEQWQLGAKQRLPSLDADEAGWILQPVAYWLHGEQKRRHATVAELRGPVEEGLRATGKSVQNAEQFVGSFTSESGLLTPWGPQQYGFVHLGFQEHLAALHVRKQWARGHAELVDALACRFGEGWWREVIRLMLANAEAGLVEGFMRAVSQRPEFAEWSRMRLMSLCLRGAEGPASARALVELLRVPAGTVEAKQQSAALRLLVQEVPAALEEHDEWLRVHPVEEVRRRWLTRTRWEEVGRTRVDPKSGVELVWIPGGWFTMGSTKDDDQAWSAERPSHEVELDGFWLGKTPVTNAQYRKFLDDPKRSPEVKEPEYWGHRRYNQPEQPVVGVSWEEAQAYCEWAGLLLPTEAQWEYACRAGMTTRYHSGDGEGDLARVGWYQGNSGDRLHAVGELKPNKFGLYDMHGNVDEWCQDRWVGDYKGVKHQSGNGLRIQLLQPKLSTGDETSASHAHGGIYHRV